MRSAMDTSETKTLTDGSSLARDDEDNSADYDKDSRIERAKLQNEREIDKQQILIDINNAESYKWGSQKSKQPKVDLEAPEDEDVKDNGEDDEDNQK